MVLVKACSDALAIVSNDRPPPTACPRPLGHCDILQGSSQHGEGQGLCWQSTSFVTHSPETAMPILTIVVE